jgi:transposase
MPDRVFQTARFKVHNPSKHKQAILMSALESYHRMAKRLLEKAVADPELMAHCSILNKKGVAVPNGFATSKYLRTLTPKGWNLAPVRDYLIDDMSAALMSHLAKTYKGKNESNPPTLAKLEPLSSEEYQQAYKELTLATEFPISAEHQERIDEARLQGQTRVAHRLERIFSSRALTKAASQLLRKIDGPMPRPIEFTHCEFGRGFLLVKCGNNLFCLLRLFSPGNRLYEKKKLADGFVDISTGEEIGGKQYPGVILPLEMGREFHENEYLRYGNPQSAKLIARRGTDGGLEFFVHIAFEFTPVKIETTTVLGIDRGAVIIGSACVIDHDGKVLATGLNIEGAAFSTEMAAHSKYIADLQRRGIQKHAKFKLRGRRADAILGEYANWLIRIAAEHKCQIVLEKIDGVAMGRFLKQSQFAKLYAMLTYKAKRVGLPEPMEVPAARTSQTCAACGHWARENRPHRDASGKPLQDVFLCVECGHEANADENASQIIALRGLQQIENGGKFSTWIVFEPWLKAILGRDGQATVQ